MEAKTIPQFEAEVTRLAAELKSANERVTAAEAALATARTEHEAAANALRAENETLKATAEEQKGKIASLDTEVATLKAEKQTVEQRAASLTASLGHKPLNIEADDAEGDLMAAYTAEKDPIKKADIWGKIKSKLGY